MSYGGFILHYLLLLLVLYEISIYARSSIVIISARVLPPGGPVPVLVVPAQRRAVL